MFVPMAAYKHDYKVRTKSLWLDKYKHGEVYQICKTFIQRL